MTCIIDNEIELLSRVYRSCCGARARQLPGEGDQTSPHNYMIVHIYKKICTRSLLILEHN